MPPKAGRGRRKKLAGKYRTQKRKAEETEDLEVQEDCTESPTRERKGRKCKKDVSPCPSKTPERSPEGSRSPQRSERSPQQSERSPQQSQESRQHSPSPPPPRNRQPESSDDEGKSKSEVGKGDKGKGKAQNENPPPGASYSFTVAQKEAIARWVESNKLLYDMKDKQHKDKAVRRHLWEGKAAEYGVDYHSIQKWYHTQRTRFSKLREGQPKKKSHKRSGDGLSSGDEEDPILAEEASENDSDRDKFIRQVFGFMKPHIRRHKKDTPASFKDTLALAETGELAGSDDSTMAGSLADEPREPTKKTGTAAEDRPGSPTMEMRVTGASRDLQDRLVQFITREQQVNRATNFCKYLETELDRLHDACLEPAYEEITTVLMHYRKVSRQFRMRDAAGDQIIAVIPVCTSATYSRVSQLQQESALPSGTYYSASRAASSPSAEFQPGPSQWPRNPPPASVWRFQECGYVEQANQQYNLEQQQQQEYHTLQPASTSTQGYVPSPRQAAFFQLPSQPPQQQIRGPWQLTPQQPVQGRPPPPLPAQQSQHNVTQDSLRQYLNLDDRVNINKDIYLSALVPHDDNNNKSQ
ncbi:DNA mismatch repair protein MSH3 [Dissostichus eleginoides]|uniref:DNA mismatch repair protein MSH3 n=1 Tax=Dissostichus eleginoides TaxID=100907 RepID=A0AAD9BET6_DISEL|nr:DNA mismatch repair protein MSH3 [Dissostichus eleginoides]